MFCVYPFQFRRTKFTLFSRFSPPALSSFEMWDPFHGINKSVPFHHFEAFCRRANLNVWKGSELFLKREKQLVLSHVLSLPSSLSVFFFFSMSLIDAHRTSTLSEAEFTNFLPSFLRFPVSQSNFPNKEKSILRGSNWQDTLAITTTKWGEKVESSCISQRITSFLPSNFFFFEAPAKALSSFVFYVSYPITWVTQSLKTSNLIRITRISITH